MTHYVRIPVKPSEIKESQFKSVVPVAYVKLWRTGRKGYIAVDIEDSNKDDTRTVVFEKVTKDTV